MNVAEVLCRQALERPHQAAVIDARRGRSRCLTFEQLERASGKLATWLRSAGLRSGDAVLIFQPPSAELYVALAALFRLGLVGMFVDPSSGRGQIERCCEVEPPAGLIAGPRAHLLRLLSPALERIPVKLSTGPPLPGAPGWERLSRVEPFRHVEPCAPELPALITFTSGSTGLPKAAVRSHGFLQAQHRTLAASLALAPGEVDLTTLPVFGLASLASGATTLIPDADLRRPGAIRPEPVVSQIRAWRPVRTVASPAFLERLIDPCAGAGGKLCPLERIFVGGGPVFPDLLQRLQRAAPGAEVSALYGSTEAEPIACLPAHDIEADDRAAMASGRGLLAGFPVPTIRLGVLPDRWGAPVGPYTADQFAAVCLQPGRAGEIVVSGAHVLAGYVGGRGDAETKLSVDGAIWHRTGDAGYLDERGRLWLLGRCSARVEDERGTLYPLAVECVARRDPAVRRAAFLAHRGRRLLLLEPAPGAKEADLVRLRHSLEWAAIDEVRVCNRIPMDGRHNSKIDYPALRGQLARAA